MQQNFTLPENASALFYATVPNNSADNLQMVHSGFGFLDDTPVYALVVKARYQLPAPSEVFTADEDILASLADMNNAPMLEADASAAQILLEDSYPDENGAGDIVDHDLGFTKQYSDFIVKSFSKNSMAELQAVQMNQYTFKAHVNGRLWLDRALGSNKAEAFDRLARTDISRKAQHHEAVENSALQISIGREFYQGNQKSDYQITANRSTLKGSEKVLLSRRFVITGKTYLSTFRFVLPTVQPVARYSYYCGHGKDERSQWCHQPLSMGVDMLEIFPDLGYAQIVWRGQWQDAKHGVEQYREVKLSIKQEVV